jgi:microcystin-dependent protein
MPRSGSGNYSLPEAAFIPNTPISSAAVNSDFDDIADALTDSLSRSGDGGMQAVLELDNDGFVYASDPNTGIRRTAGDTQAIECGGNDIIAANATTATINGDLAVSGDFTVGGASLLPIGLGPLPWSGTAAPAKWLLCRGQSLLRASYPDLWTFAAAEIALGNILFTNGNGTTTFTVADMSGASPFGSNNATGRLTVANSGVNGDILGSVGGTPNHTLITANLPAYTPAGTIVVTNGAISITASLLQAGISISTSGGSIANTGSASASQATSTAVFTGTAQGGTSTALLTQPRSVITNYIIFAGV